MHESPRIRRLRNDFAALDRLRSESSVFQFKAAGSPATQYQITFQGKGLCRDRGKIKIVHLHRIEIKLGASYPRTIPEIRWLTPIYHPNISEIGMVCLGGYGTHWVPSVQLDELCTMLWDMARYHNYDIRSPYNRDAALWVANQTSILFPTDSRPLRDLRAAQGRVESASAAANGNGQPSGARADRAGSSRGERNWKGRGRGQDSEARSALERVRQFIGQYSGGNAGIDCAEPAPEPQSTVATPSPAAEVETPAGSPGTSADTVNQPAAPPVTALLASPEESVPAAPPVTTLLARSEESVPADEGFVILEGWDDSPAEPTHQVTRGEEIIFIE
jgi:ubiquitin-protein ligase